MYFHYGRTETEYLKGRDKILGECIDKIGPIRREVDDGLFSSVVHHIIGQQISMKAQATVWKRMREALGEINAQNLLAAGVLELQSLGMTFRKAEYILDFAAKVQGGEVDLERICGMPDAEAIRELAALRGIGVWLSLIHILSVCRPWRAESKRPVKGNGTAVLRLMAISWKRDSFSSMRKKQRRSA